MASDILIVDDEVDIRELLADILQDEGYDTRTARDTTSIFAKRDPIKKTAASDKVR